MNALLRAAGLVATLAVLLVILLIAFRLPVGPALHELYRGSLDGEIAIARTLVRTTPLLILGLGVAVAWRANMPNIGAEGQFVMGGIAAASAFKLIPGIQGNSMTLLMIAAGILGGAMTAGLAGWLQIRRGVQLVISTILINFVTISFLNFALNGFLQQKGSQLPLSDRIPAPVMLTHLSRKTDLHSGVLWAILVALVVGIVFERTAFGFRLKVVGNNARASRALGMPPEGIQLKAMALSGGLCGLAAAIEILGISGQLGTSFASNLGYIAIPVALLGMLNSVGILLSALCFGALFAGTDSLARSYSGDSSLIYVLQGAAVLIVVAVGARAAARPARDEELA